MGRYIRVLFGGVDRGLDDSDDTIEIVHHVAIPKADDSVSLRLQKPGSFIIIFNLLQVLSAIQLDDEFLSDAHEIWNEIANGVLPSKVDAQLVVAQDCP
jgi:hypothetical protein